MKINTCKNCGTAYTGKFCFDCGQKASTKRFKTKTLFQDLLKKELHWDKGLLLTIRHLMTQPGIMVRGYLEGKRVNYTKPFSLLFLVLAASLLLLSKKDIFDDNALAPGNPNKTEMMNMVQEWVFGHLALVVLGMIPFLSLASKWFYRKSKLYYAEHFVLNTYALSGSTLISIPLTLCAKLLGYSPRGAEFMPLSISVTLLYIAWVYVQVFNTQRQWTGGLKPVLVYITGYILFSLTLAVLTVLGVLAYICFKK